MEILHPMKRMKRRITISNVKNKLGEWVVH
jgi:hypothetical protein